MQDVRTPIFYLSLEGDCCLLRDSDELKSPYPKGVDVDSEEGIEALNNFSIAIATTDVRDCFQRFRLPRSLSKFFFSPSTRVVKDQRGARVIEIGSTCCHLAILGSSMGFSWSLFLAQSCNKKTCLAPSLRRSSGDETTQLVHHRGPPLVFVANEQGHGGAYVFVDNLGTICDNVGLSQKMVPEWTEIFEPLGLALHKTEEHMGLGEHSGQNWTVASCPHG